MKKQNSTNSVNRIALMQDCPLSYALGVIEGRWKGLLLVHIHRGITRFGKLKEALPGISEKMLSQQLREMEEDGLINRTVFAEVPLRVEYDLTAKGGSLCGLLLSLEDWGKLYRGDKKKPKTNKTTDNNFQL